MGVVLGIAIVVVLLVLVFRGRATTSEKNDDETELRHLCHGDGAQMERLIAMEQRKVPGSSRSAAVAKAIHSMRRDK